MPDHEVLFGASLGQWNGADAADAAGRVRLATQADRDGLDLFTVADHPYFGDKLDAYALTGFLLGQTERISLSSLLARNSLIAQTLLVTALATGLAHGSASEQGAGQHVREPLLVLAWRPPGCGMMSSDRRSVRRTAAEGWLVPAHDVLFGASLGQWNGADAADAAGRIRLGTQADRDGLDLFTVADHPYFGDKLDAYALTAFLLGRTERISGMVTVTNLPSRPAPVLARTVTSLSALSVGRVILGIGAGAIWDMITKLGVPRLDGGAAVRAMWSARCPAGETRSPSTASSTTWMASTQPPRPLPGCSPARSARSPWPSPDSWPTGGSRREVRTG